MKTSDFYDGVLNTLMKICFRGGICITLMKITIFMRVCSPLLRKIVPLTKSRVSGSARAASVDDAHLVLHAGVEPRRVEPNVSWSCMPTSIYGVVQRGASSGPALAHLGVS